MRKFETGATRDSDIGKLEYSRYMHPLADYSFAKYMQSKQIIGGEYRRGDNRQLGFGSESLFDSLIRHVEILKLLYKGYNVVEIKVDGGTELIVNKNDIDISGYDTADVKAIESELNAIRFNSEGLKLYSLGVYDEDKGTDLD